jgi:hypothetical protein
LTASVLLEWFRSRSARRFSNEQARLECYVTFAIALQQANDGLRAISPAESDRDVRVRMAMQASGLYSARELLLIVGTPAMVVQAERVFRSLLEMRDAVARGDQLTWTDYRPASDAIAKAIWSLRQATRAEFGAARLRLDKIQSIQATDIGDRLLAEG